MHNKKNAIDLSIDTAYGGLDFTYIFNYSADIPIVGARLFENLYEIFDKSEKDLYNTTVKYLKNIGRYEELRERAELGKNRIRPIKLMLR